MPRLERRTFPMGASLLTHVSLFRGCSSGGHLWLLEVVAEISEGIATHRWTDAARANSLLSPTTHVCLVLFKSDVVAEPRNTLRPKLLGRGPNSSNLRM